MEKKNNSFLIGQTIIIILLIVVIVIIVMGGKKKDSEPNKLEPTEKIEEKTQEKEETKDSNETSDSNNVSKNSSNSTIKVYSSDDNRYYIILTEYPYKSVNPKSSSNTSRDFKVSMNSIQSSDPFYGNYSIENGKLKLVIVRGCTATNGEFNCTLPDGVNVTSRNDGFNEIDLNYSENEIMFGNVKLTLR